MVLHEDIVGGASRAILRVVPALENRGWDFVFWTPTGGGSEAELRLMGARFDGRRRLLRYHPRTFLAPPGPVTRIRSLRPYAAAFRAWVDSEEPAVVHANTLLTLPEAALASRRGPAVVLHVHEMLPANLQGRVAAGLARRVADETVAVSRAAAALLEAAHVPVHVVLNGVSVSSLRRRDGPRPLVIGTVGTVCRRKGSDTWLAAAERILRAHPDADLRMIGPPVEGPERPWAEALIERARRLGITVGTRTDVQAELAGWDLFVLASREDPFPLAVLEAMGAGVPVVATAVGGIPEQVPSAAGVLVAPGDPEALAGAVLALTADPPRRGAMGAAGREHVARDLTLERQAEQLEAIYLAAAQARRRA